MEPKLRQAVPSDLATLKDFQQRLVIHERPFDPGIPRKGDVEYYDIMQLIEADDIHFLVIELGEDVIGCGFGQIRKNLEWARDTYFGYIGLMFVREEFRGRGVGKFIVEGLIHWFSERKIHHIITQAYTDNINAVEAYKRYGFRDFVLHLKYDPDQ